jgi:hypothetical protein
LSLNGGTITGYSARPKKVKKVNVLARELSDHEQDLADIGLDIPDDPQRPWLHAYHAYVDTALEPLPDGWSPVQWWGVSDILTTL